MANGERRRKLKQKAKSYIPKDWLTDVRIFYRMILETFKGICQTKFTNIAIILTMFAILTIFAVLLRTSLTMQSFVDELGNTLQVSAYLAPNADSSKVLAAIRDIENVKEVKFISKEKAWNGLKSEIDVPDIQNPLPDTIHVKVNNVKNFNSVLTQVKRVKGVSDTSYASALIKKAQTATQVAHMATFIVVVGAFILTMSIMSNTILLVIQSRKEEIEIMRLMGVSNWYIKFPLILQGSIYGFVGAVLALFPLHILNKWLYGFHEFFVIPTNLCVLFQIITIVSVIILGTFCCGFGSHMCIKKHLQV